MTPDRLIDLAQLPKDKTLPDRLGRLFLHFLRQVPHVVIALFLFNAAVAILGTLMPYYIGKIVDALTLAAEDPARDLDTVWPYVWAFVIIGLLVNPIANLIEEYLNIIVFKMRFMNMVRWQTHWFTVRHDIAYFQNDFAGRIANKVQQMGMAVMSVIGSLIGSILYLVTFVASTMVLVAQADIRFLIPMLLWIAAYGLTLAWFVPRIRKLSVVASESQSQYIGRLVDTYTNIVSVKLFARRDHEDKTVYNAIKKYNDDGTIKNWRIIYMNGFLYLISGLAMSAMAVMAALYWQAGQVTPGQIAMILPLVIQIKNQMQWIKWEVTGIFENIGNAEDSMNTLARPHGVTDQDGATLLAYRKGEITYDHVSFHYGKDEGVIDDLSLTIPAGQKIGLVGQSGAGKSTLVNLLLRFYDVEGGRITIDGQDIRDLEQNSLRMHISMVTQDTSLLHRSIRENILYGRPDATDAEMIEAAKKAQAHDFILELEDNKGRKGYDAHVGERGVKLSGGQRQRIAIARIILKDAPILVLDEATSALDSETEIYIQEQLEQLMQGKTVIAIAHRLSTIAHMDRLVIMQDGRIVEDGTHDELLEKGGHYAHLWKLQSGGFLGV